MQDFGTAVQFGTGIASVPHVGAVAKYDAAFKRYQFADLPVAILFIPERVREVLPEIPARAVFHPEGIEVGGTLMQQGEQRVRVAPIPGFYV